MAASSARFMLCLSSCEWTLMWVVVDCVGSTTAAPTMWFPDVADPSVYMWASGFQSRWWGRYVGEVWCMGRGGVVGWVALYLVWLSSVVGSGRVVVMFIFLCRTPYV